jgi:hypothetical protein
LIFMAVLMGGIALSVASYVLCDLLGLLLAGRGQLLRISLEVAIHTSSLFNDDQRRELLEALSVPQPTIARGRKALRLNRGTSDRLG